MNDDREHACLILVHNVIVMQHFNGKLSVYLFGVMLAMDLF